MLGLLLLHISLTVSVQNCKYELVFVYGDPSETYLLRGVGGVRLIDQGAVQSLG